MNLWYDKPATKWSEALPSGNGRLGCMIYGKPNNEIIQLNEDSVWSGKNLDRHNPDAYESFKEVKKLIEIGEISKAEKLALRGMSGIPNSQRS